MPYLGGPLGFYLGPTDDDDSPTPTSTRPPAPQATSWLYRELAVTQPGDDRRGWPLWRLLGAIATALAPRLHDLVRDTPDRAGWTSLLDPDESPVFALPYLRQFAGVVEVNGLTEGQQREQVTSPPSFQRGTISAIRDATAKTLTGTRAVTVIDFAGDDPYAIVVRTRTSETPDPAAAQAAALSQTPFWLLLTSVVSNSPLIDEATRLGDNATALGDTATLGDVT